MAKSCQVIHILRTRLSLTILSAPIIYLCICTHTIDTEILPRIEIKCVDNIVLSKVTRFCITAKRRRERETLSTHEGITNDYVI